MDYILKEIFMRLEELIPRTETIIYKSNPNKKVYILENIFNPLLPFCISWVIIDFLLIKTLLFLKLTTMSPTVLFIFLLIHLTPVLAYINGIIITAIKYCNIHYIITNQCIYISYGILQKKYEIQKLSAISHVYLRRGFLDIFFNTGDIFIVCKHAKYTMHNHINHELKFYNITDYDKVLNIVNQLLDKKDN